MSITFRSSLYDSKGPLQAVAAAAVLARDARGPLARLSLVIESLAKCPPELSNLADGRIGHAMRLVEHIDSLLSRLVEQARAEHAFREIEPWPVIIGEIIAITADLNRPDAVRSEIGLVTRSSKGLRTRGDGFALMRVFDNLLTNAIRHSPPGGTVTIEAHRQGGRIVIRVIDDGPGFSSDELMRSFRAFTDAHRKPRGEGLSIAKILVERQGGTIRAANRRHRSGAVLTVTLPHCQ